MSAAPSTSAASPGAKKRYVVAAMGDSLTDPKSHGGKYLDKLKEKCPESTFKSFGVGGNMTNMMRKRFVRDLYAHEAGDPEPKYTDVIILGGLGDILSNETAGRTAKSIGKEIMTMVNEAKSRGSRTIVLQLPPWGTMKAFNNARAQMTWDVSRFIEAEVKAGNIDATMELRPILSCGNVETLCEGMGWKDGIHWSEKGQHAVGEALHAKLFADCL